LQLPEIFSGTEFNISSNTSSFGGAYNL